MLRPAFTSSHFICSALLLSLLVASAEHSSTAADVTWPQWRGADQDGVAPGGNFPVEWSEESAIRWKLPLDGAGGSTPVVAESTAYLTSGIEGSNNLLAVDLTSGDEQWRVAIGSDAGGKHRKGSGSNPSPVTDGKHVYAYFRSGDLGCVSTDGKIVWQTNLQERYGEDTLWWDLGTSPLLTHDAVIVAVMQTGPSYLVALDKETGDELWKTSRMLGAPEEAAQSYTTPLAVSVDGKDAIAVMGADHLTLHAMTDGRELARLGGFNPGAEKFFRSIASPVASGSIIVCPYARGATLTAVRMDELMAGKGKEAIAWFRDDLGSDVPTPAATEELVYVVGDKGLVSALDLETGNTLWQIELPKSRVGFSSSPLVAGNHLYVTRENAATYVIGPLDANEPQIVATNELADDESFTVASLVPLDGGFLLRSKSTLYRIGK